jgi:hypothetical protein
VTIDVVEEIDFAILLSQLLCQKLWQIVLFLLPIKANLELLWVHSPMYRSEM